MTSVRKAFVGLFGIVALSISATQAFATITVATGNSDTDGYFVLSHDALGESATVSGKITEYQDFPKLQDASMGAGAASDGTPSTYANFVYPSDTITYTFNTSSHAAGYDITNIATYAGWNVGGGGRSNQGYQIDLTYVNGTTATLLPKTTLNANSSPTYWTQVSLTNAEGGALSQNGIVASGIKAITFRNFDESAVSAAYNDKVYQQVMYREIDIVGTATVPEPGTMVLCAVGLFGLLAYAWRKRK